MIQIEIDAKQLKKLRQAVSKAKKKFPRELATAINETLKAGKSQVIKNVRDNINLKKKTLNEKMKQGRRATASSLVGVMTLDHEKRKGYGLQHFQAKQTKKGVSYKTSPSGGRKSIPGAFIGGGTLYGGVFKRTGVFSKATKGRYKNKRREGLIKLFGASPYAAYKKGEFYAGDIVFLRKRLAKQMDRRIKLNILRAEGLVST